MNDSEIAGHTSYGYDEFSTPEMPLILYENRAHKCGEIPDKPHPVSQYKWSRATQTPAICQTREGFDVEKNSIPNMNLLIFILLVVVVIQIINMNNINRILLIQGVSMVQNHRG